MNNNEDFKPWIKSLDRVDQCSIEDVAPIVPGVYYPKNKQLQKPCRGSNRRFILKNGEFNIEKQTSSNRGIFSKWFMTMIEARWRWTLLHFCIAFTADWLFFGFIYWIIALVHGDLTEEHLPQNQNATNWTPCVKNVYGFTSTFLFSVEVHTTLSYGKRAITMNCPEAVTAMCLQCIIGSIFQALMVGILFAKLTRLKTITQTILFSKQAVITLRDGNLCLIFRVGNMRQSRILNMKASVFLLRMNIDCDLLDNFEQIELEVEMDGCESTFLMWPIPVIHVIDKISPLYNISAVDFLCGKFEILAVFEGTLESTGQHVQARTSYTENDVLWGHRFVPMVTVDCVKNKYDVDFSKLCVTDHVDTPLCSASEFTSMLTLFESQFVDGLCKTNLHHTNVMRSL